MSLGLDLTLSLAQWLAWGTLIMVGLMVLILLMLRWIRWHKTPRLAAFEMAWLPHLMACALGDTVVVTPLKRWQRWPFMKIWLRAQMSLKGTSQERLAAFGRAMGCSSMALQRARSPYLSERMMGILALGFLGETQHVKLLLERLSEGGAQQPVYAGRALLQIDAHAHVDAVATALLANSGLDMSLASVVLKPFRPQISKILLSKSPQPGEPRALPWLRLVHALQVQVPMAILIPFLQQDEDIECLISAIRLMQGEQGGAALAAQALHADWQVRAQVARALGLIGAHDEIPILAKLLTDAQWWVRYRAAQALLKIPGMRADQLMALAQNTQDRYALSMAQAVIAEAGKDASWRR
jgi:hypothetical protein